MVWEMDQTLFGRALTASDNALREKVVWLRETMKKLLLEATVQFEVQFELQQLKPKQRDALEASLSQLFEPKLMLTPINSHRRSVEAVIEI